MEITTILTLTTLVGFALSVGTCFIGRTTAFKADGNTTVPGSDGRYWKVYTA